MASNAWRRSESAGLIVVEVGFDPEVLGRIADRAREIGMRPAAFIAAAVERYMELVYPNADPCLEDFDLDDTAERGVYREP